ncbi:hypothetical protein [Streptosporangium sp. NPDC000396]|uniref:hypothetical protein n=1 Tax=Streptosporangium sp. NPDC000396 TaxID=3366185 RepID=UPI00368A9C0B
MGHWDHVERLLLTREQAEAYRLPATEGKRGDPRWPAWAHRHGYDVENLVQWEVEGLDPGELRRLVLGAGTAYLDMRALEAVLAEERRQRAALQAFVDGWQNPDRRAPTIRQRGTGRRPPVPDTGWSGRCPGAWRSR